MTEGWIKLYRKLLDHPKAADPEFMWLWVTMLLKATHEPLERDFCGKTVTLQPGQFISGRQALAAETGLTEMKVRISIDRLKNDQQIIQQTGNKGSMFTVLNWDKYQINNQQNNQPTTSQQPLTRI